MANPTNTGILTSLGGLIKDDNTVPVGWNYKYITLAAPTNTVVKGAPGMLHSITINNPAATAVVTLYDNTAASGTTLIGTITVPSSPQPFTLIYDVVFNIGLTIKTATAAQDITVAYI